MDTTTGQTHGQSVINKARELRSASRRAHSRAAEVRAACAPPRSYQDGEPVRLRLALDGYDQGYVVVTARGELDLSARPHWADVLARAVKTGAPTIIVDLTAVTLLSAGAFRHLATIGLILDRRQNGRLHLVCAPNSLIERVVTVLDSDGRWPQHADVPTAVAAATASM